MQRRYTAWDDRHSVIVPGAVSSAQVPAVTDTSCFELFTILIKNWSEREFIHTKKVVPERKKRKKIVKKKMIFENSKIRNSIYLWYILQSCKGEPLDPFKRLLNAKKNETFLLLFRKSSSILILPKVKIIFRSGCPSGCLLRYAKNSVQTVRRKPSADPTKAGTFVPCISGHFPIFYRNMRSWRQWAFLDFFFFYIFAFCIFFFPVFYRIKKKYKKAKTQLRLWLRYSPRSLRGFKNDFRAFLGWKKEKS